MDAIALLLGVNISETADANPLYNNYTDSNNSTDFNSSFFSDGNLTDVAEIGMSETRVRNKGNSLFISHNL